MNVLEQSTAKDTARISISAVALNELLEGAMTHSGKDKGLPVLNSVILTATEGELVAFATDRFRLIEGKIPLTEGEELGQSILLLDDVKKILTMIKKVKVGEVSISREGDRITASYLDQEVSFRTYDGNPPPYTHLFPTEESVTPLPEVMFNPSFFADYAKIGGKKEGVKITFHGKGKPMTIGLHGERVKWRALLMPMRIVE